MKVTMTHNPSCGTSRNVLALLRERGIEPVIIEYLKTPLMRGEIAALVKQMHVPVRAVVRAKEPLYAELKLADADDDTLLEAMVLHPILLNRPIVTTPKGWKAAYAAYRAAGWSTVAAPPEFGGQNLSKLVATPLQEMWQTANLAFSLLPLLSLGAVEALAHTASDEIKKKYLLCAIPRFVY